MTRALDTSMEQRFSNIEEEMRSMIGLLAELSKQVQCQDAQSGGEPVKKKQKPQRVQTGGFECYNCGEKGAFRPRV